MGVIEDLIRDRNDLFKSNDPRPMKKSLSSEVLNYSHGCVLCKGQKSNQSVELLNCELLTSV